MPIIPSTLLQLVDFGNLQLLWVCFSLTFLPEKLKLRKKIAKVELKVKIEKEDEENKGFLLENSSWILWK